MNQKITSLLLQEITDVKRADWPLYDKLNILYQLLAFIYLDITKKERLYFSTLFARIAYVGEKSNIPRASLYQIHRFRRFMHHYKQTETSKELDESWWDIGLFALLESIEKVYQISLPPEILDWKPSIEFKEREDYTVVSFQALIRAVIVAIEPELDAIWVFTEEQPHLRQKVITHIPGRNDLFTADLKAIYNKPHQNMTIHLVDVEVDESGDLRPGMLVLEPDFLVDVTGIAETFKDYGTEPLSYLLKKFLPSPYGTPILIGHTANYFLDELIANVNTSFKKLFPKVFQINPLSFALMNDGELKEFMQKCTKHFYHLRQVVRQALPQQNIQLKHAFLEPSFFSVKFGIQGRLDLFHQPPQSQRVDIVELKSGKNFRPNAFQINTNHYIQTLLYDLIIQSVFPKVRATSYILYSHYEENTLRPAPVIKQQQKEAIHTRNQLVLLEKALMQIDPLKVTSFFDYISKTQQAKASGFFLRDIELFEKSYRTLSTIEKKLWLYYVRFIATEHHLAKIGQEGIDRTNGLASLWLDTLEDKEERFEIFSNLQVDTVQLGEDTPQVTLSKTELTNPLANFRIGDIVILYPYVRATRSVLKHQIFKCTILAITPEHITIRLRNKQASADLFKQFDRWNIEKDLLDSSFSGLYRGLLEFAQSPPSIRQLLMGQRPPTPLTDTDIQAIELSDEMTEEQQNILRRIIRAEEFFLLWGPPGTGKTSIMLKHLVQYLVDHTDQKIVLVAYTNRAVDEIGEAIESIRPDMADHYFRIGSRFSTHPHFQRQLLSERMKEIKDRQTLVEFLQSQRIVVATISSLANRRELFDLMHFDTIIVDEASQILDPQLMGLLTRFKKFVLVGDHKQLPAVVAQNEYQTVVEDETLLQLGYMDLADSLFERLYKRCIHQGWDWAYALLSHQGRMHRDLMSFPSKHFYDDQLTVLQKGSDDLRLVESLPPSVLTPPTPLEQAIHNHRLIFIPTGVDQKDHHKTNRHEAQQIVQLVQAYESMYRGTPRLASERIGIITPYRAQIALIKDLLAQDNIDPNHYSVDTIERYQGSARDIILFSLCTNHIRQLSSMISLSSEGIDRKLNVALTRARFHLVLVGNAEILSGNDTYQALIEACELVEL